MKRQHLFPSLGIAICAWAAIVAPLSHAEPQAPVTITAVRLEVAHANRTARFIGKVKVTQTQAAGSFVLESDAVQVEYGGTGKGGAISRLEAQGNVVLSKPGNPPEMATGDKAVYTPAQRGQEAQLVLSGRSVTLSRGPSRLTGDRLVYSLKTQQATVTNSQGSVKATFVPQ